MADLYDGLQTYSGFKAQQLGAAIDMQFLDAARKDPAAAFSDSVEQKMTTYAESLGTSVDKLDPSESERMRYQMLHDEQVRFFGEGHQVQYLSQNAVKSLVGGMMDDDVNVSNMASATIAKMPDFALNELAKKANIPVESLRMRASLGESAMLGNVVDGKVSGLINAYYKDKGALKSMIMQQRGFTTDSEYQAEINANTETVLKSKEFQALYSVMSLRRDGELQASEMARMLANVATADDKVNVGDIISKTMGTPVIGSAYSSGGMFSWKHNTVIGFDKPGESFFSSAAHELRKVESKKGFVSEALGFKQGAVSLLDAAMAGDKDASTALMRAGIMIDGMSGDSFKVRKLIGDKSLQSAVSGDKSSFFATQDAALLSRDNLIKAIEKNIDLQVTRYARTSALAQHPNNPGEFVLVDTQDKVLLSPVGMKKGDTILNLRAANLKHGLADYEQDSFGGGIIFDQID